MDCSTPGFSVQRFPEFPQTHPLSWWCHPTISCPVIPFFSCLQSFPASGSFPRSQFFTSGGQNIAASASASVLLMNIQGWFPLGLTDLISLRSKGLSRAFFISASIWLLHYIIHYSCMGHEKLCYKSLSVYFLLLQANLILLHLADIVFFYFLTNWRFVATLHWASLSALCFQAHLLTSCLWVTFQYFSLYCKCYHYDYIFYGDLWSVISDVTCKKITTHWRLRWQLTFFSNRGFF